MEARFLPPECGLPLVSVLQQPQLRQSWKHTSCLQSVAYHPADWLQAVLQQLQLRHVQEDLVPLKCGSPIRALAPCLELHELRLRQVEKGTSCLQNVACSLAHQPHACVAATPAEAGARSDDQGAETGP